MTVQLLRPTDFDDTAVEFPPASVPAPALAPAVFLAPASADEDETESSGYPLADDLTAEDMARVSDADYNHLRRAADNYRHAAGQYAAAYTNRVFRLPAAEDLAHDAVLCLARRLRDAHAVWTSVDTDTACDVDAWLDERPDHGVLPINRATLRTWALDDAARHHGCDIDALTQDDDTAAVDRPRRTDLHLVR